jgi:uncharacterized protein (TIGR04222 family)
MSQMEGEGLPDLPFFDLPGPAFLNFFGIVVVAVLLVAFLAIYLADSTGRAPPPPIPDEPDAMAVALLSGGVGRVIQTLVYDLDERGFATLDEEGRIAPTDEKPASGALNEMELRALAAIRHRPTARQLFEDKALRHHLFNDLAPVRAGLAAQNLLQPPAVGRVKRIVQAFGALIIIVVAGVRLQSILTVEQGNPSYLVFLAMGATAALVALCYVLTRETASKRGQAFVVAMQAAYRENLARAISPIRSPGPKARAFGGAALYLVALYGFAPLRGTTESRFLDAFQDASGNCDE